MNRIALPVLTALAAALALPAAASATTVDSTGGTITVTAGAGESNHVIVSVVGSVVQVFDTAGVSSATGACTRVSSLAADCTLAGVTDLAVDTGDLGDRIINNVSLRSSLVGGTGDDEFVSGPGRDAIRGGTGRDQADYSRRTANLVIHAGSGGDDDGEFNERDEVFDDVESFEGGSGNDEISAPPDSTVGGTIRGGAGDDRLFGARGDDALDGGPGADLMLGGDGVDEVLYGDRTENVVATIGGIGDDGADTDGDGDADEGDTLWPSVEVIESGSGDDVLGGSSENERLFGGDGDDRLIGQRGDDLLDGGDGEDWVDYSYESSNLLELDLDAGTAVLASLSESDELEEIEHAIGTGSDDVLRGDGGDNVLRGGPGADRLDGAGGSDTADYRDHGAGDPVVVTIGSGTGDDGEVGGFDDGFSGRGDTVPATVENAIGTDGDDRLTGDGGANGLVGGRGADTLSGAGGPDALDGGEGSDVLSGGGDADELSGGDGVDAFDAGEGDDRLATRDGVGETVACGGGSDSAVTDWQDTTSGCETNDATVNPDRDGDGIGNDADCAPDDARRPAQGGTDADCDGAVDVAPQPPTPPAQPGLPAADRTRPKLTLVGVAQVAADGSVAIKVTCDEACSGRVALVSARRVRASRRARAALLALGSKSFALAAGGTATVKVKLSRAHLALLKRLGRLAVKATGNATDAAGNATSASAAFTARAPAARRARARRR